MLEILYRLSYRLLIYHLSKYFFAKDKLSPKFLVIAFETFPVVIKAVSSAYKAEVQLFLNLKSDYKLNMALEIKQILVVHELVFYAR